MVYEVSFTEAESRPTAVVAATTTWQDFPSLWGQLLGEVWDCLRAGGIHSIRAARGEGGHDRAPWPLR
jgi:hypothetical protein